MTTILTPSEQLHISLSRMLSESNYPAPIVLCRVGDLSPSDAQRFREEWLREASGISVSRPMLLPNADEFITLEPTGTGAGELVSLLTLEYQASLSA